MAETRKKGPKVLIYSQKRKTTRQEEGRPVQEAHNLKKKRTNNILHGDPLYIILGDRDITNKLYSNTVKSKKKKKENRTRQPRPRLEICEGEKIYGVERG